MNPPFVGRARKGAGAGFAAVRQCFKNGLSEPNSCILRFPTFASVRPGNCQRNCQHCSGREPLGDGSHQADALFYLRSLVSSTAVATVIRPLLAKEALEEFYRARYDSVRQFLAKLLARLAGVTQSPILRDLLKGERHAYPR
jgi:hypothetical protein